MTALRMQAVGAAAWGFIGTAARIALQLVSQVTLARLLGPDQYGLFAVGLIVVSLAVFVSDFGLAYGLIQKKEVSDMDERFVFTWQVILGAAVMLSMITAAAPTARFFNEPKAEIVVQSLSVVCLLTSLSATSQNLLKRAMDFRWIQLAQVASYFTGFIVVGVPMAYFGFGVYSLVAAWCVQSLLYALILYWRTRHAVIPAFWHAGAMDQIRYGLVVLITNLVNWFTNNVDKIFVGRFQSSYHVGLYSTTNNILYSPTAALLGVLQQVFFSAASRADTMNDVNARARVAAGYSALSCAVGILVAPMFSVVAALSLPLVELLYGKSWIEAGTLFVPLSLAMPFILIWGVTTPLLWSGAGPLTEAKYQFPLAIGFGILCFFAAKLSVQVVAWCFFSFVVIRTGLIVRRACTCFRISGKTLLRSMGGGVFTAAAVFICASTVDYLLSDQSPLIRVTAGGSTALFVWILLLSRFWSRLINSELLEIIVGAKKILPARVTWLCAQMVGKG